MNFPRFLTVATVLFGAISSIAAADRKEEGATELNPVNTSQNFVVAAPSGSMGRVSLQDVAAQVDLAAIERFSNASEFDSINRQLKSLWHHFPENREISEATASHIAAFWRSQADLDRANNTPTDLDKEFITRVWQTYHCLLADRQPLSADEVNRKAEQVRKLAAVLDRLDLVLIKRNPEISDAVVDGVRSEAKRCLARLKEYTDSPAYPWFYYPLSDSDFEKAMVTMRAEVEGRIESFIQNYPSFLWSLDRARKGRLLDKPSQEFNRIRCEQKGAVLAALTMGSIARHYGHTWRTRDYSDSMMFPFWKVNGAGVGYNMHSGLRLSLRTVSTP